MKLSRCPNCHSHISLEQVAQDQASSELLALLAEQTPELGRNLVIYLGLFRPLKSDLSNVRALKLVKETLCLSEHPGQLSQALHETSLSLKQKRLEGQSKPLANHNYLKRVLENTPVSMQAPSITSTATAQSKSGQALLTLQKFKGGQHE